MSQELTPEQALQNLYTAARMAKLTAAEHDILKMSVQVVECAIKEKAGKQ